MTTTHIEPDLTDLTALCAAAEDAFHRGALVRSRTLAAQVLAATRAQGDRATEARALQLVAELEYDELSNPRSLAALDLAIAIRQELFGDADVATRYSRACRAVVLTGEERLADADVDLTSALAPGGVPESPAEAARQARFWVALGSALHGRDRDVEARRIFEVLLAAADLDEPLEPLALANTCLHFASLLESARESERALALNRRLVEIRSRVIGVPSLRVALGLVGQGTSQLRLGCYDDARATLLQAIAMLRDSGNEAHPRSSIAFLGLAVVEMLDGRGPASAQWINRAVEIETRTFGGSHRSSASMLLMASRMFGKRGHHGRAAELAQRAAAAFLSHLRGRAEPFQEAIGQAFESLRQLKRHDDAIRWLEPMLRSLERADAPQPHLIALVLNMLGAAYSSAGKVAKAEAVLRRSMRLAEEEYGAESQQMQVLHTNLAGLLTRQKRTAEARAAEERAKHIAEVLEEQAQAPLLRRRWRGLA